MEADDMPRKERMLKLVANGGPSPVSTRGRIPSDPTGTYQGRVEAEAPDKPAAIKRVPVLNKLWDEIIPTLVNAGVVSKADGPALELMLRHYALAVNASNEVLRDGSTLTNYRGDEIRHPADYVFKGQSELFLKYADKMGATFASRARTRVKVDGDSDDDNPFA